ncbi:hypothetical protein F400_gp110 [Bacillus phage BCD7]|uniref:Uncharacterized protein n=1 Tax=Bacillus phage BCD7 TaxID=1136534 RepID=J9PUE2_9CAUD|nr:hypothetical protein F400_gp110 [Bacillus phage BCD7]AEZ50557.1 hypothetical protein BCD7_0110 [Bacillus phage BCD7]
MKIKRIKKTVKVEKKVEHKEVFPPARFPTQDEIIARVIERNEKPDIRKFDDEKDMQKLIEWRFRNNVITIRDVYRKEGRKKAIERAKLLGHNGGSAGNGYSVFGKPNGIAVDFADKELNQYIYRDLISYARIVDWIVKDIEGAGEEKCQSKEKPKLKIKRKPKLKLKRKTK